MSDGNPTGYLPGDPRYGLQGEALKDYYRTKPAQWAIYCWDKPGTAETRRALLAEQKSYVKHFGERVIGYGPFPIGRRPRSAGHVLLHAARRPHGGGRIYRRRAAEQGRRLSARRNPPLVEQLWQARRRLSPQGLAAVPVHRTQDRHARVLPSAPARPRILLRILRRQFIFRGPIRSADGADNIGTALLLELPDRAAADTFWNNEPFARNGGYQRDARIIRWVFGD